MNPIGIACVALSSGCGAGLVLLLNNLRTAQDAVPAPVVEDIWDGDWEFVRNASFEMCNSCYSSAYRAGSLPNAAPRKQRSRRQPEIRLVVNYVLWCEVCGGLPAAADRETSVRLRAEHVQLHRGESAETARTSLGAIA